MHPTVSVCIPTYNYARYIGEAVESVLGQTFGDFELLVQDDCSTDDTEEVVSRYLSDPRVKFEKNEHNLGLAGNWNRCLEKASGKYIKYVFADDMLISNDALKETAAILDSRPDVSLVASSRLIIDETSRAERISSSFKKDFIAAGEDIIHACFCEMRNLVGEPTAVLFRKEQAARGFRPLKHLLDMEMWLHLLEQGKFAFLNEPLCAFRVHPAQKTVDNVGNRADIDDYLLILRQYLNRPYIRFTPFIRKFLVYDAIYQFWKSYRKGILERREASMRIRQYFSEFFLVYPFFRLAKPPVKLYLGFYKRRFYA